MQSQTVSTVKFNGKLVDVVGYYNDSTYEGLYEWFDFFEQVSGHCLNEGDPFYTQDDQMPTAKQVLEYLSTP